MKIINLFQVGIHLKAFFPQLQITFVKASNDPNPSVKQKATSALEQLMPLINNKTMINKANVGNISS